MFCEPSSLVNPGPGHYKQGNHQRWNQASPVEKAKCAYNQNQHQDLVLIAEKKAPSIPARKLVNNAYTGLKQDTIGPACYYPKSVDKPERRKTDF